MLSKVTEGGSYIVVQRSASVTGTEPNWPQTSITLRSLCNGDKERGLKIECYQERRSGSHSLLGNCFTTLEKMVSLGTGGMKLMSPHDGKVNKHSFES